MESRKILSSLCYFSILFAGFILPLVVYFVTNDTITKVHAKKAFLSHLIPLIGLPVIGLGFFFDFTGAGGSIPILGMLAIALVLFISFVVLIWNIVKGVKVLLEE